MATLLCLSCSIHVHQFDVKQGRRRQWSIRAFKHFCSLQSLLSSSGVNTEPLHVRTYRYVFGRCPLPWVWRVLTPSSVLMEIERLTSSHKIQPALPGTFEYKDTARSTQGPWFGQNDSILSQETPESREFHLPISILILHCFCFAVQ